MIKLNSFIKKIFLFSAVLFSFIACKSAPVSVEVRPLDILDEKSSFYLAIPKSVDPVLIQTILQNNIEGLSDKNATLIVGNINKIYCGLNRSKNKTSIQATIDASIPQKYTSKILNKKNGFSNRKFIPEKSQNEYTFYSNEKVELVFPSSKIACLGRELENVISTYDTILTTAQPNYFSKDFSLLDKELYDYLDSAEDEIRFFANKPQSFLTILTGANLDLKLVNVKGSFSLDSNHNEQYLLNLDLNFRNEKFLKAGRTLLTLAFGLTDSQSEVNGTHFLVKGIKIHKNQLYKLLIL